MSGWEDGVRHLVWLGCGGEDEEDEVVFDVFVSFCVDGAAKVGKVSMTIGWYELRLPNKLAGL